VQGYKFYLLISLNQELAYVKANSDTLIGFAIWAAGSFDTSYILSVTPKSNGTDQSLWSQAGKSLYNIIVIYVLNAFTKSPRICREASSVNLIYACLGISFYDVKHPLFVVVVYLVMDITSANAKRYTGHMSENYLPAQCSFDIKMRSL
jgi:hypothetical protein